MSARSSARHLGNQSSLYSPIGAASGLCDSTTLRLESRGYGPPRRRPCARLATTHGDGLCAAVASSDRGRIGENRTACSTTTSFRR